MASDKKILMFDESTGMLSREVIAAYISNELSPSLRQDVEDFLAKDEMHRDIIEGLKLVLEKNQAEKAIHDINERIAEKTGAAVNTAGVSIELPEFFSDYKKIAAIAGGILLLSGAIFTVMLLRESSPGIASSEKDLAQEKPIEEPPQPVTTQQKTSIAEEPEDIVVSEAGDSALRIETGDNEQPEAGGIAELRRQEDADEAIASRNDTRTATEEKRPPAAAKKLKNDDNVPQRAGDETAGFAAPVATDDISIADNENETGSPDTITTFKESAQAKVEKPAELVSAINAEMPEYPGGEAALRKYIRDNLQYPIESKDNRIEGKVELDFYVGTTGRVKNIRVTKGINKEINTEAVRLIANMPKWKPGKQSGKPATMLHHLTIDFSID